MASPRWVRDLWLKCSRMLFLGQWPTLKYCKQLVWRPGSHNCHHLLSLQTSLADHQEYVVYLWDIRRPFHPIAIFKPDLSKQVIILSVFCRFTVKNLEFCGKKAKCARSWRFWSFGLVGFLCRYWRRVNSLQYNKVSISSVELEHTI